ncbi:sigma-70 family RNA polymerase sigma factor [Pseudooceanicola sp. CBS1P-1]|uniref:Sigma-70 family RNA polymerase sigma factor n=1 Tax=Pseudooceanicola albus TaxID=2692189 RepID=A0A6L7G3R1_9RHOB|nr:MULTISPECIES: sigma-70 family RNA polymerase sigma factor [Pseudooceanicola]MBT9382725.1 sigma-70 family RNA polymerase sigma factor [Pseudooceanicola endophyticus]MXN17263.1 sigma-70 family RNA polymerase sigma factor [Pseudooceanicola albus]
MTDRNMHWGELLRRARRGDGAAYARFLSEVTPAIRTVVRARARGDEAAVEDIVQEVLLGLHAKRHTWNEDAPVTPWLYAIARYKAADALRARRLRRTDPLEDHAEGLVDDTLGDPTAARDLGRLLEGIDTRSAGIVRSLGVEGESAGEVGARLGLSEGAVRVAYHRAMTRLRRIARGPEAKPEAKDD